MKHADIQKTHEAGIITDEQRQKIIAYYSGQVAKIAPGQLESIIHRRVPAAQVRSGPDPDRASWR